jgi:hypothetical protein
MMPRPRRGRRLAVMLALAFFGLCLLGPLVAVGLAARRARRAVQLCPLCGAVAVRAGDHESDNPFSVLLTLQCGQCGTWRRLLTSSGEQHAHLRRCERDQRRILARARELEAERRRPGLHRPVALRDRRRRGLPRPHTRADFIRRKDLAVTLLLAVIIPFLIILAVLTIVDVLRHHSRGTTKAVWIVLVILLPVVGSIVYWLTRKPAEAGVDQAYLAAADARAHAQHSANDRAGF